MKKYILTTTLMMTTTLIFANEGKWGLEPLGQAIEVGAQPPPAIKQPLQSHYRSVAAEGEPITLYRGGTPIGVIVIPEKASPSETDAANLLADTFHQMTGTRMSIVSEEKITVENGLVVDTAKNKWPTAIWLGATKQAPKENLPSEGYKIISKGSWVFVFGDKETPSGKQLNSTYYAAAALLERHFGVRWLWPSEVGTVIPKSKDVVLNPLNEQDEPVLVQRMIRNATEINDRARIGLDLLGGSSREDGIFYKMRKGQKAWLRNHKVGGTSDDSGSVTLNYRHAYKDWYKKYGKTHPEWFALQPDGTRIQKNDERSRLCKSNPEAAKQRAREIISEYEAAGKQGTFSLSPNDGSSTDHFCMCEECRKLDPANAPKISLLFSKDEKKFDRDYVSLTDRVVVFYNRIAEEVAKKYPEIKLGAYAYSSYRDAPMRETLHPSVLIGFVGLDYFDENTRQKDLQNWDGWSRKSSQMFLRPNALHRGNGLPAVYTYKLSQDIKHCYETGMTIADFDSLIGNWSTQGLNYYVLAKLLWDPSLDVDTIVKDYCDAGFGKASGKIQEYFKQLEEITSRIASREAVAQEKELREEEQNETQMIQRDVQAMEAKDAYFSRFTPELSEKLRAILKEASAMADDETIRHRIAFLENGLDYLELYRKAYAGKNDKTALKDFLAWYRNIFQTEPYAIDSTGRLWRTSRDYRGIDKKAK